MRSDNSESCLEIFSPFGKFVDPYALGCSGTAGVSPTLNAQWVGTSIDLQISQGLGGSIAALIFGMEPKQTMIAGNTCSLLVTKTFPLIPVVNLSGSGAGAGAYSVTAPWPTGLPYVFMQALNADPGTSRGYSATNGLQIGSN